MEKSVTIKGYKISKDSPMVCVPVCGKNDDEIMEQVREAIALDVSMIEWRVDYYEKLNDFSSIEGIMRRVSNLCSHIVLLFTFRSKAEGGNGNLDEDTLLKLYKDVAKSGWVDIIDVEYFRHDDPKEIIASLKAAGVKVIASKHDFDKTEETQKLAIYLFKMEEADPDFVKLAVMPKSNEDVLFLMAATAIYDRKGKKPSITMSMGSIGNITRVCGYRFGSCVTFASAALASAPGQMNYKAVCDVIDLLEGRLVN